MLPASGITLARLTVTVTGVPPPSADFSRAPTSWPMTRACTRSVSPPLLKDGASPGALLAISAPMAPRALALATLVLMLHEPRSISATLPVKSGVLASAQAMAAAPLPP